MAKICPSRLSLALVALLIALPTLADTTAPPPALHDLAASLIEHQPPHVKVDDDHPLMRRAAGAARDLRLATDALVAEGILPKAERDAWERDEYTWSFFEAGWLTNPNGSNDLGSACGVGQVHLGDVPAAMLGPDARKDACAFARKDRVYAFRTMLRVLLAFESKCGTRRAALAAFSTDGACKTWEPSVVKERCALVPGGC